MYMAKSSNEVAKKARVGRSPRPILGCGNRGGSDRAMSPIHDTDPPLTTERTGNLPADNVEVGVRSAQSGASSDSRQVEEAPALGVGERREVPDSERNQDREEGEVDEGRRNEEAAVSSSQSSVSTLRVGEGESVRGTLQQGSVTSYRREDFILNIRKTGNYFNNCKTNLG